MTDAQFWFLAGMSFAILGEVREDAWSKFYKLVALVMFGYSIWLTATVAT